MRSDQSVTVGRSAWDGARDVSRAERKRQRQWLQEEQPRDLDDSGDQESGVVELRQLDITIVLAPEQADRRLTARPLGEVPAIISGTPRHT